MDFNWYEKKEFSFIEEITQMSIWIKSETHVSNDLNITLEKFEECIRAVDNPHEMELSGVQLSAETFFNGRCLPVSTRKRSDVGEHCPENMGLYDDENNQGFCDCLPKPPYSKPRPIYSNETGVCYGQNTHQVYCAVDFETVIFPHSVNKHSLARCPPDPSPATSTCRRKRPVCMSFTFEGHGDHYVKLSMLWCRGWTHPQQQRQPAGGKASLYVIQPKRCRGWVRTTRVATLSSRSTIAARLELRGKGEKKSYKRREKRPQ
ncbi:hypothetical protein DAPPUDRAFT_111702 [Daphnia pulex]|uniref:DUF4789 domain-containing protein n=1 Tax=Daphnia pulex TaxID=6669 RepID=E9H9L3_DAPPU|nr:hypothetical protein DAPPUDRAFT_111702 [Daphnia pulex]|eukprot:EFX71526.1 hypothetical protein DAPPUDRAFT_111702 [Daphnia pulex]